VLPSPSAERYGFSTTRGFRTAVARNRARRRLREAFKAVYREGGAPRLFIGVAKPAALSLSFEELKMEVDTQLARLDRPDASRKARAR
jgi:ribonuclease P protein component